MELRHFRYFLAVAEELNFGRAAQRLRMAQPPLSRQIRALEGELGVPLFLRSKRGVKLTDAGRVFRDEARAALARVERATESARRASRGELGGITLAFAPGSELALIPRLIPPFVEGHPDVWLDVQSLHAEQQLAALHAGTIHAGLVPMPVPTQGGVAIDVLLSEELCAVLPQRHRLASRPRLTLELLAEEPIVFLPRSVAPRLHDLVVETFRHAGLGLTVRYHASHVHTCLALVGAGLGVTLLPAGSRGMSTGGVVYRRLVPASPKLEIAMIYRRDDPSELLHEFAKTARTVLAGPRASVFRCGRTDKVTRLQAR